ncbi:hypothetical protein PH213_20550 [Streptomyces sp. SRF1]|uniref:hypothetical protein n=1 Tax=Streptomyces sp. SRF1 TaxID=1549642 RepID=UPI0025B228FE|nr:hypothetical protein [Streptomyces sp. SRF1]MDN3056897.1 hypothetical protein [Streptomyces sp. SRF1]
MRYVYRCNPCQAAAPERSDQYQARADRDQHRERAHHGLIPNDRIGEVPGPLAVLGQAVLRSGLELLAEGSRRAGKSKAVREVRASEYWRQAVRLLWIGAGVLVLAALVGPRIF